MPIITHTHPCMYMDLTEFVHNLYKQKLTAMNKYVLIPTVQQYTCTIFS